LGSPQGPGHDRAEDLVPEGRTTVGFSLLTLALNAGAAGGYALGAQLAAHGSAAEGFLLGAAREYSPRSVPQASAPPFGESAMRTCAPD
jgi:hypothetical protein